MIDIKAIKAAAEKATPGEWLASDNGHIYSAALNLLAVAQHCRDKDANAKHIATANPATVIALCDEIERLRAIEESRDKAWAVAKSLQAQVNILLPVVWAAADDDDEYGIGPKARKALEALAAHKET